MYSVRGPDGKVYGPVPLDVLRQWVREGRLLPTTQVTEMETGFEVSASNVPGLFTAAPGDWSQPPSPYPRAQGHYQPLPGYSSPAAQNDLNMGWTYFGIGTFGCFCCPILAWIFYPLGITNANKVLSAGDSRGQTLKTLSIAFLILSILGSILWLGLNLASFMVGY